MKIFVEGEYAFYIGTPRYSTLKFGRLYKILISGPFSLSVENPDIMDKKATALKQDFIPVSSVTKLERLIYKLPAAE